MQQAWGNDVRNGTHTVYYIGCLQWKRQLVNYNIEINLQEMVLIYVDWGELTQDRDQQWVLINIVRML